MHNKVCLLIDLLAAGFIYAIFFHDFGSQEHVFMPVCVLLYLAQTLGIYRAYFSLVDGCKGRKMLSSH